MKSLLVAFLFFFFCQLALVGFAIAEGFLIHWATPAVDLSAAVLLGMGGTVILVYWMILFIRFAARGRLEKQAAEEEDEEEDEEIQGIYVPLPPLHQPPRRRQRKKK